MRPPASAGSESAAEQKVRRDAVPGGVEFEIGIEHSGFAVRCPLCLVYRAAFARPSRLQGIRACEWLVRPLHRPALVPG